MQYKIILLSILTTIITSFPANDNCDAYTIKILTNQELALLRSFFAEQRIALYAGYPYLYKGNIAEESVHFDWFITLPHTVFVVAYYEEQPVAFVGGTSFTAFDEHFKGTKDVFQQAGFNPDDFYYFSDLMVTPEHRKKGLGNKLTKTLENYVHTTFSYNTICLVCEHHDKHPLKPENYSDLAIFFSKSGYTKTDMHAKHIWLTRQCDGSVCAQEHTMTYWIKHLND